MAVRLATSLGVLFAAASLAVAQPAVRPVSPSAAPAEQWRAADSAPRTAQVPPPPSQGSTPRAASAADTPPPRRPVGAPLNLENLPASHGQVWAEYDISPYTLHVTTTNRPEQAVVDWILRETGYEAWHSEPVAVLSAGQRTLRVYHTPQIQQVVADLVDRFVGTQAQSYAFGLRVVTVGNPNWRQRAQRIMRSVPVQSAGVQAWLLQKEDAATLLAELSRRGDFREHSSPYLLVHNGQANTIAVTRPRSYVRDIIPRPGAFPSFESQLGQIDEGFTLEFSPLLSADGQMIDAVVKCHINNIERMAAVMLEVPSATAPGQRARVEVPQVSQYRFQERFRWPADQVLLVGLGLVPSPLPGTGSNPLLGGVMPILPRADLLLFIDGKGSHVAAAAQSTPAPRAASSAIFNRGRY